MSFLPSAIAGILQSTTWHVMTRTAQCEFWLLEENFRDIMDKLIKELSQIYYIEVHTHAIQSNHYHLVLTLYIPDLDAEDVRRRYQLMQKLNVRKKRWREKDLEKFYSRLTSLSWFMWDLNKRSATRFNKIRGTKGHYWGGRYKSVLIEDDRQMSETMSYVDQNPVRSGLVEKPSDYPYCTSGHIKRELALGIHREMPPVGFLKYIPARARAQAWMKNQDRLAILYNANRANIRAQQQASPAN